MSILDDDEVLFENFKADDMAIIKDFVCRYVLNRVYALEQPDDVVKIPVVWKELHSSIDKSLYTDIPKTYRDRYYGRLDSVLVCHSGSNIIFANMQNFEYEMRANQSRLYKEACYYDYKGIEYAQRTRSLLYEESKYYSYPRKNLTIPTKKVQLYIQKKAAKDPFYGVFKKMINKSPLVTYKLCK